MGAAALAIKTTKSLDPGITPDRDLCSANDFYFELVAITCTGPSSPDGSSGEFALYGFTSA